MSVAFGDHVALLTAFLDRRQPIVDSLERSVLDPRATNLPAALERCFFLSPGLPRDLSRLHGQLAAAHLADGFDPIPLEGRSHALDPVQLVMGAHEQWNRERWPGRRIRLAYAEHVYAAYLLRQLEYLSLRLWDTGLDAASDRLHELQRLLDRLNEAAATVMVRDARWLIQSAQGALTRHLQPYFTVAGQIDGSFTAADRLAIHTAGAKLTGGHLRSQLRYRALETRQPADEPGVLATTRNSNSMDVALLLRDLVSLLEAYHAACAGPDPEARRDLADAILQGLSSDPELLITRLDLLAPCTMIEDLFIRRDEHGRAGYTALGDDHVRRLERYGRLLGDVAAALEEHARALDPADLGYSPFGIAYGFCADILSSLASASLGGLQPSAFSLEDVFGSRRTAADRTPADYSREWATQVFAGLTRALRARAANPSAANASGAASARLVVLNEGTATAQEHCVTSDVERAIASGATAFPRSQCLVDRHEARFLASAEIGGKWFGVSKVLLTTCLSQGRDAVITGVPAPVVDILRLTCPGIASLPSPRLRANEGE